MKGAPQQRDTNWKTNICEAPLVRVRGHRLAMPFQTQPVSTASSPRLCSAHPAHGTATTAVKTQHKPGSDGVCHHAGSGSGPQPGSLTSLGISATWGRSSEGACGHLRSNSSCGLNRWTGGQAPAPVSLKSFAEGPGPAGCPHLPLPPGQATHHMRATCLGVTELHTLPGAVPGESWCHPHRSRPALGPTHLPVPVARVAGDTVVQAPVGQRLLFVEDKFLQLHLHFCAGHSAWRGRKHRTVTGRSAQGRQLRAEARQEARDSGTPNVGGC